MTSSYFRTRHVRTALRCAAVALAVLGARSTSLVAQQPAPTSGVEVLQRMHDVYQGKWYHTLTFVQRTTAYRDTTPTVTTWYESLRHTDERGTQLRIDIGEPSAGNGILYTADSSWRVRNGVVATQNANGNEFLPMIEGVYMQPVLKTVNQMKVFGIDMAKVRTGTWQDRKVWIVGASTASDTASPQFWIDADRNVVVRMLMPSGAAGSLPMDIHLDGYVPAGKGWLASRVAMSVGGKPRQIEEYSDWKIDVPLDAGLFSAATWTSATHWVTKK